MGRSPSYAQKNGLPALSRMYSSRASAIPEPVRQGFQYKARHLPFLIVAKQFTYFHFALPKCTDRRYAGQSACLQYKAVFGLPPAHVLAPNRNQSAHKHRQIARAARAVLYAPHAQYALASVGARGIGRVDRARRAHARAHAARYALIVADRLYMRRNGLFVWLGIFQHNAPRLRHSGARRSLRAPLSRTCAAQHSRARPGGRR